MSRQISAVVLDMDGLMLDTEPLYRAAWQSTSANLGFELSDQAYARLIGRPMQESEAELQVMCGAEFPLSQFRARWPEVWRLLVGRHGIPLKRGLRELLALLEARHVATAIATSSDADYAAFSLRSAGLLDRVPVIVTRDQVAHGKPAPDLYLEAARRLQRQPTECLALEDSDVGVLAACAAGMTTICVPDMQAPSDAVVDAAFRVLGSLSDVCELLPGVLAEGSRPVRHGGQR